MMDQTDQLLRNKMNSASAQDLMDNFDEAVIWERVQEGIAEGMPAKKPRYTIYWRYAAILMLGLLSGFYAYRDNENEVLSAQRSMSKIQSTDTITKSPKAPSVVPVIAAMPVKRVTQKRDEIPVRPEPGRVEEIPLVHESVVEPPSPQDEILTAGSNEIAVVYLEDIQRRSMPVAGVSEKKSRRKLVGVSKHNTNESSSQELPVRNLVYALNQ